MPTLVSKDQHLTVTLQIKNISKFGPGEIYLGRKAINSEYGSLHFIASLLVTVCMQFQIHHT